MRKVMIKGFCIMLFSLLFISTSNHAMGLNGTYAKAYGASKPMVKETSKTLYVNYDTYQIQISNLSRTAKVTYKSSNEAVAEVTGSGVIKPIAKGKAVVTAAVKQNNQKYTYSITITVKEPYITFTNSPKEIEANSKYIFSAAATGLKKLSLEWTSSNETVGRIDHKTGEFTAIMVGETVIKVMDQTSKKTKSLKLVVLEEYEPEDYGFDIFIWDNEVSIYGFTELKEDVIIPDLIGGCPVTKIESWAFAETQIKSITFGKYVTYIGGYAFFCARQMTKAVLPEGVVELDDHSFDACSALVEINIPDSVQRIGGYAFDGCSSLRNVKVDNTIKRTLGENIFNNVALSNPVIAYKNNVLFHLTETDHEMITLVTKALKEMGINDTDPEVEKVKKVHDWIIYNVMWESKENDIVKIQKATGASDLAIALKYHIGVCEHYMVAFQTFMEVLGIENMTVLNVKYTHGWNMVKLDGDWYMLDIGHDGPNGYLMYKNFLFNNTDTYVYWGDLHAYDASKYPLVNGTKYTNYVDRKFSIPIVDVYKDDDLAAAYR